MLEFISLKILNIKIILYQDDVYILMKEMHSFLHKNLVVFNA